MAYDNLTDLIDGLVTLDIPLVSETSRFKYPPNQVNTAQLPIMFVGFPEIDQSTGSFNGGAGQERISLEFVILVGPVLHNTNQANHSSSILIMTQLRQALEDDTMSLGLDSWNIKLSTNQLGDTTYWSIISTVMASK